ncbi:hypothetical protein GR160_07670 [Flavobacterium sp. Sd200]|uniref:hypothetical protein n=1 Tax=Flavobacterium sp. Sd200 TaxID=2692211 RepID=UPI001368D4E1|nr:hypothetical protein [Flavobacterium sp. Sd200]MXN91106.1 hypothetical protein [Flavobacterium sp. Sd200]
MENFERKELTNSVAKTLFSVVPYVGGLLNEVIFDYRGRVKQERINNFILLLAEYFGNNPIIDNTVFTSEDFGDLFESVLKRVALTKSKEKHIRFRDILTNFINYPYPNADDTDIFLDLVNYLNDTAIVILKHHQIFDDEFELKHEQFDLLNQEVIRIQGGFTSNLHSAHDPNTSQDKTTNDLSDKLLALKNFEEEFKKLNLVKSAKFYGISEDAFLYYKQILFAQGLLSDKGIGALNSPPFTNMSITEFGSKFIGFIINKKEE